MRLSPTRNESLLLLAFLALCVLALAGPAIAQPPQAHDFADQRALWGLPHALDVLSNLPFVLAGAWGLRLLQRVPSGELFAAQRACAGLFFLGLLTTAVGSTAYHLAPNDWGLAWDRTGMSVAFAGLLGLVAAARVSDRAGLALSAALLVLGPVSAIACLLTGNVLAWAVVQFGGIALLLLVLAFGKDRLAAWPVRWSLVLLAYAVAKLAEANDAAVLQATGELFSGHTLKHVVAAFAAAPVLFALGSQARRQNGRSVAAQSA